MKLLYHRNKLLHICDTAITTFSKKYEHALEADNLEKKKINSKVDELIQEGGIRKLFWSQKRYHEEALKILGHVCYSEYGVHFEYENKSNRYKTHLEKWKLREETILNSTTEHIWLTDDEFIPYANFLSFDF